MEAIDNSGKLTYIDMGGIAVPDVLRSLAIRLEARGFEAYAVGGCVRDMLMGRKPCDFDLITNADFRSLKEIFPEAVVLSKKFSVVHIDNVGKAGKSDEINNENGLAISADIATYRNEESYRDGRPYEFFFVDDIEEDLPRRDFTINAIAMRLMVSADSAASASLAEISGKSGGEALFIDMFGGVGDLHSRTIRSIGAAEARFKEDPLRMLRAVRIAAQLNFEPDEEISKAITSNSRLFENMNGEKAGLELLKLLTAEHAGKGLGLLFDRGAIHMLLGGAGAKRLSVVERLKLKRLCKYIDECKRDEEVRLRLFFSCFKRKRRIGACERLKIQITCKT